MTQPTTSLYRLAPGELAILRALVGRPFLQLVWDLNAFYIRTAETTVKVEAVSDIPQQGAWSEVVYIRITSEGHTAPFEDPAVPPHAYSVIATSSTISRVDTVSTAIWIPEEGNHSPTLSAPSGQQAITVDCGVLLTIPSGIAPAVQLGNSFGFSYLAAKRLYSRPEIDKLLASDYEAWAIGPNAV